MVRALKHERDCDKTRVSHPSQARRARTDSVGENKSPTRERWLGERTKRTRDGKSS